MRGVRHAEAAISGALAGCEEEADVFMSAERRGLFDWVLLIRLTCYVVPGGEPPLHMLDVIERIRKGCEKRESRPQSKWVLTKFQQLMQGSPTTEALQMYLTEAALELKFASRRQAGGSCGFGAGGADCGQHPTLLGVAAAPPALEVFVRISIEYEITLDGLE